MSDLLFASDGLSVVLRESAVNEMRKLAASAFPYETGGVLVGEYAGRSTAVVTKILGPCPDAEHGLRGFSRGTAGLDEALRSLWDRGLYYLGEWHTHPAADPTPSDLDAATVQEIAEDPKAQCPQPILVILGGIPVDGAERWSATVYHRQGAAERLAAA